jgi:hypothetical protein
LRSAFGLTLRDVHRVSLKLARKHRNNTFERQAILWQKVVSSNLVLPQISSRVTAS